MVNTHQLYATLTCPDYSSQPKKTINAFVVQWLRRFVANEYIGVRFPAIAFLQI